MRLFLQFLPLSFSALLPVINPIASALLFLGVVGSAPPDVCRRLARKIAINTIFFLLAIDLAGAAILKFFGISLPVVQFAGGFVLAALGWNMLNSNETLPKEGDATPAASLASLQEMIFYPLTFPITAGPGTIVVALTLSAHASNPSRLNETFAQLGILGGVILNSIAVYLSYAYAQQLTLKFTRQTVHGVLRVIAFILLCIGVQIAWRGLSTLLMSLPKS